jgi:hypothetical protein
MLGCFLLLLQKGATWVPLIAIPAVIAGTIASLWFIISGIKGIIAEATRPKRPAPHIGSSKRALQWIGKRRAFSNARHQ